MIGLLFTIAFFPLVGFAMSRAFRGMNAFLAGAGATGAVLFVTMVWHVPMLWTLMALAVVAIAERWRPRRLSRERLAPVSGEWRRDAAYSAGETPAFGWADIASAIAVVLLLIAAAIVPLHDYDGRAFWLIKAKAIAHEQAIDGPFFHGRTAANPRNAYPLLVPLDAAAIFTVARDLDDQHTRWLYACFAIAFALEIRRRLGSWLAATFLWLPQILLDSANGGALTAYADIALGAFVACAFFELLQRAEEPHSPLRFGLWLSFIALTKNEGLPLTLLLLVAGAFVFRKRIAIAIVPPLIAVAHLLIWRARVGRSDEENFARTLFDVPQHLDRFAAELARFFANLASVRDWGLVLVLIAIAWFFARRGRLLATIVIVPMILLYAGAVSVTAWDSNTMRDLAPRAITHLLGPLFFILGDAIARLDRSQ